jgi:hypothetical protein
MDAEFFQKLVIELEAGGCSVLKIGGLGEPVLHPDFAKMMDALSNTKMKVMLYTNGTALSKWRPEQIYEWNIHSIILSIDGLNANSFERQRKNGNYSEIRTAAVNFANYKKEGKPILEIRHVIVPNETSADLRAFKKDWLRIGDTVKFNYLIPLRPVGASIPANVRCRDIRREVYIRWDSRVLVCAGQEAQRHGQGPEFLGEAKKKPIADMWFDVRLEDLRVAHNSLKSNPPALCQHCAFR